MTDELREMIAEENPDALFADGFDECLVGAGRRNGQPTVAVYDYHKAVAVLSKGNGMTVEEALEHMEFNVVGAWVGDHTPVWLVT